MSLLKRISDIPESDDKIFFHGVREKYGFCSNWYPSEFVVEGITYISSEQWMMYQKAVLFGDTETAEKILLSKSQKDIKALGRKVKPFEPEVWDSKKVDIVYTGILEKFRQNDDIREKLLATGEAMLVEAAPKDTVWGIGLDKTDSKAQSVSTWRGQNLLGYTLMLVREDLRSK